MSLISCPECKKTVSDQAEKCPHCGRPVQKPIENKTTSSNDYKKIVLGIVGFALLLCIVWWEIDKKNSEDHCREVNSSNYYIPPKTGREGALEKAQSYLNSSAFSYSGLIHQLEYHGFSHDEAVYGADNCGADWFEQAERQAKSYLRSSAYSYTGLIDQLEYSGFTHDEAVYGADNCGADWFEQAVKDAQSYLRSSSRWTRESLIHQLVYEGYTGEEARYGADNCGQVWND